MERAFHVWSACVDHNVLPSYAYMIHVSGKAWVMTGWFDGAYLEVSLSLSQFVILVVIVAVVFIVVVVVVVGASSYPVKS